MKRLLPDSLAGWGLVIVIAALTVAEITTLVAIAQSRIESTRLKGLFQLEERVFADSRAVSAVDPQNRQALADALGDSTLAVQVDTGPLAMPTGDETLSEFATVLDQRLSRLGVTDVLIARQASTGVIRKAESLIAPGTSPGSFARSLSAISDQYANGEVYVVSTALQDGSWINYVNSIAPPPSLWTFETLASALGGIVIVLVASTWALRQLTGQYAVLAEAAERFSTDLDAGELAERGPREVRKAAHAFNLMRGRLKRIIADRDTMIAAVSHDFRTPVTRLRLRAEFVEDAEQKEHMLADLDAIETMTRSVLAMASDAAVPEERQLLDLVSLLESVCSDLPDVSLIYDASVAQRVPVWGQPVSLRRCIGNLVENAVKYGKHATVTVTVGQKVAEVTVEDEGPGINPSKLEDVFRPFTRLEASRNRDTGGTGLGLTIARSVARGHGGDVVLSNRPEGGLRALLVLPLPAAAAAVGAAKSGRKKLRETAIPAE